VRFGKLHTPIRRVLPAAKQGQLIGRHAITAEFWIATVQPAALEPVSVSFISWSLFS
jgi:hypothetical protein